MNKHSIDKQLQDKWQSAEQLPIPSEIDKRVEQTLLDAFSEHQANAARKNQRKAYPWLSAIAASFLIVFLSWKFFPSEEVSQSGKLLALAIDQSQQLDSQFEQLKAKSLSEYVYIQKFRLEVELSSINTKLAEAYSQQDSEQQKLQLWHQRNQTLSQLTALMANADNRHTMQI